MPIPDDTPPLDCLLSRPDSERAKEHKYRFGQGVVFGIPVILLQYAGPLVGGAEAPRWTGLFQALLAGWVLYVAATGMVIEGLLNRRCRGDLAAALTAAAVYIASLVAWVPTLAGARSWWTRPHFDWAVELLVAWTFWRWQRLSRAAAAGQRVFGAS